MRFHIACPSEFAQEITLREILLVLYHGLVDLGHQVTFAFDRVETVGKVVNLLVNPHLLVRFHRPALRAILDLKVPFGVFSTELLDPDAAGFNGEQHNRLSPAEYLIFRELVERAWFVWSFFRQDATGYGHHTDRFRNIAFGHCDALQEVRLASQTRYDLVYYGSTASESRRDRLTEISKSGLRVMALGYCHYLERNSAIALSRAILHLNHPPPFKHATPVRFAYGATNRICVLTDPTEDEDNHMRLGHVLPEENFAEACCDFLSRGLERPRAEAAHEMIRAVPMADVLDAALNGTDFSSPS